MNQEHKNQEHKIPCREKKIGLQNTTGLWDNVSYPKKERNGK